MTPEHRLPTASEIKALRIIRDHGPLTPRFFAERMWPDSEGWRRSAKCGPYGAHIGGGMPLAAGGYLGKLARRGWIEKRFETREWLYLHPVFDIGYVLTEAGADALREAEVGEGEK